MALYGPDFLFIDHSTVSWFWFASINYKFAYHAPKASTQETARAFRQKYFEKNTQNMKLYNNL